MNENQFIRHENVRKGNGLNFGVDYLGYKGEIATSHADYLISLLPPEKHTIMMEDIIRLGRVAANTNKQAVILDQEGNGIRITWKMRQKMEEHYSDEKR